MIFHELDKLGRKFMDKLCRKLNTLRDWLIFLCKHLLNIKRVLTLFVSAYSL
jgi:hypothetical protein